jgi:hypothetical protein
VQPLQVVWRGRGVVTNCTKDKDTQCASCEAGEYSEGGSNTCAPCNAGTYSVGGSKQCEPCVPGKYSSDIGQSVCNSWLLCDVGSGVVSEGNSTTDRVCRPCVAGEFSEGGSGTCGACVQGKEFSKAVEQSVCSPCKSCGVGYGLVSSCNSTADTFCQQCVPGECSDGSTKCVACGPGTIPNRVRSACVPCKSCASGAGVINKCANETDTKCEPCQAGKYSVGGDSNICETCDTGTYSNKTKQSVCIAWSLCGVGSGLVSEGNSTTDRACRQCVAERM